MTIASPDIDFGERFDAFMAKVSAGQYKAKARTQRECIVGILRRRSTWISEICRALNEKRRLIHTEKRVTRNLGCSRYKDDVVLQNYLKLVGPLLFNRNFRRPTIACDVTDIGKPWATKIGHLARVRDGSAPHFWRTESGEVKPIVQNGFEMILVEAVGEQARRMPLYAELFSVREPGWLGFRPLLRRAILAVKPLKTIGACEIDFVVRLRAEVRSRVWANGQRMTLDQLLPQVTMRTKFRVHKYEKSKKTIWDVEAGWVEELRLPAHRDNNRGGARPGGLRLSLVVISNPMGDKPLVVVTNLRVRTAADARMVANAYHDRWGSEEAFRFAKGQLGLERMRAFKWDSLKRLAVLTMLAYGYLAYLVHTARDAVARIASSFKAFGRVPEYLFYRMLEGVVAFLQTSPAEL